jgi:hypothetical protein
MKLNHQELSICIHLLATPTDRTTLHHTTPLVAAGEVRLRHLRLGAGLPAQLGQFNFTAPHHTPDLSSIILPDYFTAHKNYGLQPVNLGRGSQGNIFHS